MNLIIKILVTTIPTQLNIFQRLVITCSNPSSEWVVSPKDPSKVVEHEIHLPMCVLASPGAFNRICQSD